MHSYSTQDMPAQAGKVAVVTGANTGLGYQTALALAGAGAHVVLTARDAEKGRRAVERLRATLPDAQVELSLLDLADLASVAGFAERVAATHDRIDLLVNNAGVMTPRRRTTTRDGFELQMGVNFLGHFALTARLLPAILNAAAPRVVSLSSIMHRYGTIDFDDLMSERSYKPIASYSRSKLATLIFAHELERRAEANGWTLRSVAAHPGIARTELTKARPGQPVPLLNRFSDIVAPLFTGTAEQGALPSIYAATAPEAKGGGYYGPTGLGEIRGPVGSAKASAASRDPVTADRLWREAERLTGLSLP